MDTNNELYIIPSTKINQNNSFINRVRTITRKCSFCNCQGHNITQCNNEGLTMFINYLSHLKDSLLTIHNNNHILSIQELERYLYNFCSEHDSNTKLIKAISCRFCNTRLRSTLQVAINKIIMYLFNIDCLALTMHEHNHIPFNEYTPVRITSIIDGILLNYMANNQINNSLDNFKNDCSLLKYVDIVFDATNIPSNLELETELECSICYNSAQKKTAAKLQCHHEFCIDCIEKIIQKKIMNCPYCRNKIEKIFCYNEECFKNLKIYTEI